MGPLMIFGDIYASVNFQGWHFYEKLFFNSNKVQHVKGLRPNLPVICYKLNMFEKKRPTWPDTLSEDRNSMNQAAAYILDASLYGQVKNNDGYFKEQKSPGASLWTLQLIMFILNTFFFQNIIISVLYNR